LLFQAGAVGLRHDLLLELVGDVLRVTLRHHGGGSLAGAKAGQTGKFHKLGHHGLMLGIHFALIERDHEAFAGV
jgi:hypothetical protein